jgi:hypothetical protein
MLLAATPAPAAANPIGIAIIILILLLLGFFAVRKWLMGPTNKIGINNVVLSITPTTLPAGSAQRFNASVTVMGYSDTAVPRDFVLQLIDHDPISNDVLDEYRSGSGSGVAGLAMTPVGSTPLYSWQVTHTFTLSCDAACKVVGSKGSSGESDPKIFARFSIKYGTPEPTMDSNPPITIKCTPVPE